MFDFEKNSSCVITTTLKQRFCKDMGIPIKIFEEPYFSNLLELYDFQFNCIEKYKMFVSQVEEYSSEQNYFIAYNKLKDDAIEYLKSSEAMEYFSQKEDMSKYAVKNTGFTAHDIFKETFDGRFFVSIDMKKGNFTALFNYNPNIVGNKSTYEEFIGMFTDKEYFKMSKYIRQVIFGNINPKRQVTYEKYLMDKILTEILKRGIVNPEDIVFFSTDEIVFNIPDTAIDCGEVYGTFPVEVEEVINWAKGQNINIRAEFFELRKIKGTDGYVKKFKYNKDGYDFKCLDFLTYPFVLRAYKGEAVKEIDKVFLYEGKKAQLLEDIKIEIV